MVNGWGACPTCGLAPVSTNGRDRRGQQAYRCRRCGRRFTDLTGTAFSGYHFSSRPRSSPWRSGNHLRYRLSLADVAEWLAERGVQVHRATIGDWVQRFTPLYQAAARPHRRPVTTTWSVDETYVRVGRRLAVCLPGDR